MSETLRDLHLSQANSCVGCRAGDSCAYVHDAGSPVLAAVQRRDDCDIHVPLMQREDIFSSSPRRDVPQSQNQQATIGVPAQTFTPMAGQRPTSRLQLENPREFQLNQIRRRFRPKERDDENNTILEFKLCPTDPDFSYDITALECVLYIPKSYPAQGKPSIEIQNRNLETGIRSAVSNKFSQLANSQVSMGLLRLVNALDRELEDVLKAKEVGPDQIHDTHSLNSQQSGSASQGDDFDAKRRKREVTQLHSRLGRDRLFSANLDGTSFTVPIRPIRSDLLPASLKQLSAVNISVPLSYPAVPCQLNILGVGDEVARYVEIAFDKHARDNPGMSLIAHINYFSAMTHNMITPPIIENSNLNSALESLTLVDEEVSSAPIQVPENNVQPAVETDIQGARPLEDKPHVLVIPRPPEWGPADGEDDEDESDFSDEFDSDDSLDDNQDHEGGERGHEKQPIRTGREVLLSFPSLELHGIELLELKSVSLTLKCERCKDSYDLQNLKIGENGVSIPPERVQNCGKCSSYLTVGESCTIREQRDPEFKALG